MHHWRVHAKAEFPRLPPDVRTGGSIIFHYVQAKSELKNFIWDPGQMGGSIIFHHVQAKSELINFSWDPSQTDGGSIIFHHVQAKSEPKILGENLVRWGVDMWWAYRPIISAYMCQHTNSCNSYFTCYCHECANNNMPQKAIYANHFMCTWKTTLSGYICLIWTHCNQHCDQKHLCIHFTLLAYAPEQICLPNCTYMSHCTITEVYIYST